MKCGVVSAHGFGDWVIINPIIRILAKKYEEVLVTYNDHSKKIITNMFSDLPNVKLTFRSTFGFSNILEVEQYCKDNNYDFIDLLCPGHLNSENLYILDLEKINEPFNKCIYTKAGFNWEKDCVHFHIPIDEEESKEFHVSLKLPEKYIFLHESDYPKIDRSKILDKDLPIFTPFETENDNVFLYKHTIEHATEIHVVNSGFYNFTDKLNLSTENYFLHKTRTKLFETPYFDPALNKPWKQIIY